MAEMQWYAATDSGRFDGTAAITPRSGAVCLRAELPAGVLQNAVAALPWTMAREEKLFMNGYQTWTACPELGKWDRQHGVERVPKFLLEKYSFDRYGDYHFVPYSGKRGQSHGFSYCYFRRGKTYRLLASLDEAPGYTIFSYDSRAAQLRIERDCAGVQHTGGSFPAFSLFFAEGTEDEVFDAWFAALGCRPRTTRRLAGYSSWYNRYQNIDEASIQEDLNGCKTLFRAGDLFQIDDGWERKVGDWLEPDLAKFPNGLRPLACGTGACAVAAAAVLTGRCPRGAPILVQLPGGTLEVCVQRDDTVLLTGDAAATFSGTVLIQPCKAPRGVV